MWEQERNGKLYLCEAVTDPLTGRRKTYSVRITSDTAKGRREADRRLREKMEEGARPKRLHLSDLIELYGQEHERTVRESTYKRDMSSLKTLLKVLDNVYIDQMNAGYIRRKLIESGKENGTMNELIKRFKSFLMWAYRNDYCTRDVADKLTLFPDKSAREKIQNKFLERDELHLLIETLDLERWKLLTEFLALSGLRIGEAIALDKEDIDSEYIHVTKTYNENLSSIGDPKTSTSRRDVYIQPELADVIKRIRICMMKQALQFGYQDRGFFFSGIDGGRIGYAAYNKQLREAEQKMGIGKHITPHILRHTMTSLFASEGVELSTISRRLGHDGSAITQRVYMHVTKERKEQDIQSIKSVSLLKKA